MNEDTVTSWTDKDTSVGISPCDEAQKEIFRQRKDVGLRPGVKLHMSKQLYHALLKHPSVTAEQLEDVFVVKTVNNQEGQK